jgi:hypothetical protein
VLLCSPPFVGTVWLNASRGTLPHCVCPSPARAKVVTCHVANDPLLFVPFAFVYRVVCHLASLFQPCSKSQWVFSTCTPWASCTGTCVLPMCCWCHWSHCMCVSLQHRHSAHLWCVFGSLFTNCASSHFIHGHACPVGAGRLRCVAPTISCG